MPNIQQEIRQAFGGEVYDCQVVSAPGRVNLIGEHIDYHGLAVLPIALRQSVRVAYSPRVDRQIRATSAGGYGVREFEWTDRLVPVAVGDWENYLRAAAQAVSGKWGIGVGVDATITSDVPPAAGLSSSSSALIVAFSLSLLRANHHHARFDELMEILPEGEQFVGTRGGGMDHAASLASQRGCASLIGFDPLSVRPITIPEGWCFLIAHSLQTAEKSAGVLEEYNARRRDGAAALQHLGFRSYRTMIEGRTAEELVTMAGKLDPGPERDSFLHVTGEALRVKAAVSAMERNDPFEFGRVLVESHASLRDRLKVSCPALDRVVEIAMECGALGARLTGAGFGGCAVVLSREPDVSAVRRGLLDRFYGSHRDFDEPRHLIQAQPGPGALRLQEGRAATQASESIRRGFVPPT
jgi:galactokinase